MTFFKGDIAGYPASCSFLSGRPSFTVEGLPGRFESYEKAEAAVKDHDLAIRKDFTNRQAYLGGPGEPVVRVEVTSVSADGRDAWVKREGKRDKVGRLRLLADEEESLHAAQTESDLRAAIKDTWAKVQRWEPRA